ncbi:MAG: HD domain-containing protein [candidate division Zixibacteria bacterium]|nr:HD domain-containing protein [candidate division Zixibacteria bacterium]
MEMQVSDAIGRVLAGKKEAKLLNAFFVLYKNARIIESSNRAFRKQIAGFYEQLKTLSLQSGQVTIKVYSGRYFVDDRMVRFDDRGLSGAGTIAAEWRALGLGGVEFSTDISAEEIGRFIKFISSVKPTRENVESLSESLKSHGLTAIKLLSAKEVDTGRPGIPEEVRRQFRTAARSTFFKALAVVEDVVVNTAADRQVNISRTKRVVHSLIDHITRDESSLLELSAIKDYDDYTYAHSTNVCVYALTLGVRLNLDRARLSQLGFTALFHDVGKVKLPSDLIKKPDAYDENDWIQMQQHPLLGAKSILRNMKLDVHTARAARGAFEHHVNRDFTGYPALRREKRPVNLFSKIISIVDTFDALSSGRVYLKKAIPPDKVLKKMHYQMAVKFDPFLLKIFNDIIGIFPAGSVVLLTTEEIALVLTNNEADPARPFVKIVGNREGLLPNPVWADLSHSEQADRRIVRMIDPARHGLDAKDFILND